MDNQQQHILLLLEKYEKGLASANDVAELETWYQTFEDQPDILAQLTDQEKAVAKEGMLTRLSLILVDQGEDISRQPVRIVPLWHRWMAAAILLILVTAGGYFLINNNKQGLENTDVLAENFLPASDKAILTLSGGKEIMLNGTTKGYLATQGNSIVNKMDHGELVYDATDADAAAVMNTLSTPRGGKYQLALADGTRVWLNAASSITYPSGFSGNQRQVEITGEVYFEVVHSPTKPFLVKSKGQIVEVLGTHFNIKAYEDEQQTTTTLIKGSVAVTSGTWRQLLKPGEQAIISEKSQRVSNTDTDEAMAWMEGYFQFVDADIESVMRQISRWYDVEIVYEGTLTKQKFTGRISRTRSIGQVLKIIQSYQDVKINIQERRIMVK